MHLPSRLTSVAVLTAVLLAQSLASSAHADETLQPESVAEFAESLDHAANTDPVAAESAVAFDELSSTDQHKVVEIVSDPAFAQEFLKFVATTEAPEPSDPVIVEDSDRFAGVEYQSEAQVSDSPSIVGAIVSSGFSAGRMAVYPANTTQTVRTSSSASVFGVTITQLSIWITFKTASGGIPKTVLSSGSSATNLNFLIVISNQNLTPYVSSGLAVATTVWTGSVLVKGGAARFDKVDTLKVFNGGIYSHTLVNR
jgi:hypothetical protein